MIQGNTSIVLFFKPGEEEDKFWEGVKTAKTKVRQDRCKYFPAKYRAK